jgi:C4-dicarboxylate transporter, DctQ subunit
MLRIHGQVFALLVAFEYRLLEMVLLVLVVLNGANVSYRYILQQPAGYLFEIMISLSLVIYWIGSATAQRQNGHLGMSFLVALLPDRPRRIVAVARTAIVAGFLLCVVVSGTKLAWSHFQSGMVSGNLNLPIWIWSAFLPIGALLMLIRVLRPPRIFKTEKGALV